MAGISKNEGPVAVTGASGYIGSRVVEDLMKEGYEVHACVRDKSNGMKVDHLLNLNSEELEGSVKLFESDLLEKASYDKAFEQCVGVIHCGAALGFNRETPQEVYDGCFTQNEHVIESVKKAQTVKRFVFTSSFAAVGHPRPEGYVFTEKDWCGDNVEGYRGAWTEENISSKPFTSSLDKVLTLRTIVLPLILMPTGIAFLISCVKKLRRTPIGISFFLSE